MLLHSASWSRMTARSSSRLQFLPWSSALCVLAWACCHYFIQACRSSVCSRVAPDHLLKLPGSFLLAAFLLRSIYPSDLPQAFSREISLHKQWIRLIRQAGTRIHYLYYEIRESPPTDGYMRSVLPVFLICHQTFSNYDICEDFVVSCILPVNTGACSSSKSELAQEYLRISICSKQKS